MISVLLRKIKTVKRIGFFRSINIGLNRLFLTMLAQIYKFHPWHAEAPTSVRPYRTTIAKVINNLKPTTVVEIGCGLGFILALIHAPQRYGYDLDEGAIKAARFLYGRKITFIHGDSSIVTVAQIDVLILVNWIHELSPETLEELMAPLLPRTRFLLLDAIDSDNPSGYRYTHDFAFLESKAKRLSVSRVANEGRSFQLFELIK